jgi:hypothetical protein
LLGTNHLRSNPFLYGQFGNSVGEGVYDQLISSDEATEVRKRLHDSELKTREALGLADRPPYPNDYEVSKYGVSLINEAIGKLPLGNLESVLGSVAKGVDLKVPSQFKEYIGSEENLDVESRKAVMTYKQLAFEAIRRGSAFSLMDSQKYADINAQAEKLNKKYGKAEKEE